MRNIWSEANLGDASAIYLSSVDKHVVPGETEVRLCNYLDVYRNRRLTKEMRFSEGSATPAEIGRFALEKGDLVITKNSETPDDIGIPALVVDDLRGTVCGYHLAIIRPRSTAVSSGFLLHYLQSDSTKRHFLRTAAGLTRFGLGLRAISSLPVPIPSFCEQTTIAGILDAVDMAIDRAAVAVARARGVKDAVLQNFFYEAMGETAYADRPRKNLPSAWSLVEAGNLLSEDPKNGVSPPTSSHPPGIPTFSIAAVREGHVDLANPDNLKYAHLSERIAHKFLIRQGDVLVVRGNANPDLVGRAGVVGATPDGCIYPDIVKRIAFRTDIKQRVLPEFGALVWNHSIIHNQILRRAKTSNGTLKINNRDVKQIIMPVPPEAEQATLVNIISAVQANIIALKTSEAAYRNLKRALMHDLLTGRVRVKTLPEAVAA